jgi:phage-related protein (TIGR01555 family)
VHDLPAFEMTRAGRAWQATKEQIELLEQAETAFGLWAKVRKVLATARLHGGAALVLGVRAGSPETPLVPERVGKDAFRYIFVASRHQLFAPWGFETDPESDFFGQPAMWEMRGARGNTVRIHPSRVIPFHGSPLPAGCVTVSQIDEFWGDPLLVSIKSAIDNAEVSQAAVATLLHEMKLDVISIPGLTEQIAREDQEAILAARIEAINRFKTMFGALLLDRGDGKDEATGEKWETRQLSFAQTPELLRAFLGIVAGAADMPVTRLMGESPGGLQSTGKGEQDDFNRMIAAKQTADLRPALARIDEVLIRSTLGSRPPEIYYEFAPLEDPDEQQEATNEKLEAETVEIYSRTNLIPSDALAKVTANRLIESGRWPGLDKAIEESDQELGAPPEQPDDGLPTAANENDVANMEQRRQITRDQAIALLTDASPRSLYVSRKLENKAEVLAWAKTQNLEVDVPDLHVTIMSSRVPVDWMKLGGGYGWGDDKGRLTVEEGGPRIMDRLGGDLVLLFASNPLVYRHEDMRREGAEFIHPGDYQPHMTLQRNVAHDVDLSAIEPYRGRLVFGPEIFEEFTERPYADA